VKFYSLFQRKNIEDALRIHLENVVLIFIFTIRFLRPVPVTRKLLGRVEFDEFLSEDSSVRECIYREIFQPIDDTVSSCAKKEKSKKLNSNIDLSSIFGLSRQKRNPFSPFTRGFTVMTIEKDRSRI
jgi:hypothetical protein